MTRSAILMVVVAGLLGAGMSACARDGETPPAGDMPADMPMGEGMEGMPDMGMTDMRRHAEEADSMAAAMRERVIEMRNLTAGQWHERMGEHVGQMSPMLNLMNRQMREMDMGMGMSDEQMGQMMGMSGEEHRRMMDEMQALRSDLERLQTASRDEVQQRMSEHLDRMERMAEMMEQSATHMRSR